MNDSAQHDPNSPDDTRAAAAFRAAMSDLRTPGDLDPDAARRRAGARRNVRLALGGLVLALIVAAGAVVLPNLFGAGPGIEPAGQPTIAKVPEKLPRDPAPSGWRTEQYRELVFQVPADWGYAYEPGSAWCAGSDGKTPRPEHRKPYVSLGEPDAIPAIACPRMPDALITQHVAAIQPADKRADGRFELANGFWEVLKTVGAVKLRVVSQDADLAEQIAGTAREAGDGDLCRPDHPITKNLEARPQLASDVRTYGAVDRIAVCQYDTGEGRSGLRATAELTGEKAQQLIDGIAKAPANDDARCDPPPYPEGGLDVAAVLRVQSSTGLHEIVLRQQGCPNGGDTVLGGFDDGTTVHAATKATCSAVFVPPVSIQAASGSVFERCVPGR
ncbi:hypothetical protein [Microlunatus parietis]|uniref:Uncharacterized protein n=1 Tax=Microlunatus parietis TaxID=682979 RepID=A0A7Y9I6Q2_9ACTN|nr:hypothetical protein [Microlunatus parietis]NYE71255.1 hypothetical protein [Microlunatus parietis]